MMKIVINDKELGQIEVKLRRFPNRLIDECRDAVIDIAHKIRNTIIKGMYDTPKSGKRYRRGKKWHTASSPGNYPAVDSGELVSRIIPPDIRSNEIEVGVEAGAPHGIMLESGTKHMKPRPWLQPSLEKHELELEDDIGKAILRAAEEAF